jgi:hypothetical protein
VGFDSYVGVITNHNITTVVGSVGLTLM